ncbi:MAG TPA: response regulator [Pyrinomonadaceae bacterium]|nr:response regulator [Pyrinomonadaceae bacterium]
MSNTPGTKRNPLFGPFLWVIAGVGSWTFLYSVYQIDVGRLDFSFVILLSIVLLLSSRISVPIPRLSSQISVSDTLVFLVLLLYGGATAILVGAIEAVVSSLRFSRKAATILFNLGCAAVSLFLTSQIMELGFGDVTVLAKRPASSGFLAAVGTMALVHYATNSGLVGIGAALKTAQPIWQTWRKHYLWTSITYFAGACAAGVIAVLVQLVGFYAFVITLPIIAIVFLTYRTYLKNVETSAAQADQAEKHVKELSHYIAEQDRIREQFSQMEKLSALGELASGVAHDFNNTLAGILGRAQLLLRTDDPEKIKRGLGIIIKTAEDGAKTVKRIQDFARQRRDHDFEPISIDQILTDASEITRPRWKNCAEASNIHITVDLQIQSQAMVMGDDSELREVLVNMVFNSVDAMPEGGKLLLSTSIVDKSVVIKIADTGVGMYPEIRSRIFDPFFTTKGKAGLGLGLAVSFGIIRRHGGTIEVDSEYGKGTEFRIILPIASVQDSVVPDRPLHETPTALVASNEQTQGLAITRLLVVDDEDFVRDLLKEILESEGCEVLLAGSGNEALQLFSENQFDAVFTDVGMPGMSGWELAQAIRQQNQTIPIAVITGWGEAVGSNEQKAAGVDWVIAKPFTADRIIDLIKEISTQSGSHRPGFSTVAA